MRTEISSLPRTKPPMSHAEFLALAVPLIVSTLSTPLLGAVDTAVVGQLPDPAYIGGVAVGSLIFNTLYWLLGFLRVSTSGFSAQAFGANDKSEVFMSLIRPLVLAVLFGLTFILFQNPIQYPAMLLTDPTDNVKTFAAQYFDIRIWGAPFALVNYAILGWLMGIARVRMALFLQVFMNLLNIVLDIVFVAVFHMNIGGVAVASLIAEISAAVIGILIIVADRQVKESCWSLSGAFPYAPLVNMLRVNRDLFIRTVCLLTVITLFTAQGAAMGEVWLAAS
ncbi:MATE family efflux transporter [Effusibacillus consociatus]|uniref:MATE family efflux transporter n=1 Tax=Effusibacillus consociatus TaxID=1117041 RepID=A0ABV9Q8Y4_9BACL